MIGGFPEELFQVFHLRNVFEIKKAHAFPADPGTVRLWEEAVSEIKWCLKPLIAYPGRGRPDLTEGRYPLVRPALIPVLRRELSCRLGRELRSSVRWCLRFLRSDPFPVRMRREGRGSCREQRVSSMFFCL